LRPKKNAAPEIPPPTDPAPPPPSAATPRSKIVQEIITTEEGYVNDLEVLINYYLRPCQQRKTKKGRALITPQQIQQLFSNVEAIANLNQVLYKELHKQVVLPEQEQRIGQCFLLLAKCLLIYTDYCSNQPQADELLVKLIQTNSEFAALEQENMARPECRRLGLNAYLIKPVQRACKYPLLLRELLKETPPSHPDYKDLTEACEAMQSSCLKLNERKREVENMSHFLTIKARTGKNFIESGRRFIEDGTTIILMEKKNKRTRKVKQKPRKGRYVLFSDMIVFIVDGKVIAQLMMHCSALAPDVHIAAYPLAFALVSRANRLVFLPGSEPEREKMMALFSERIEEIKQHEKGKQTRLQQKPAERKMVSRAAPAASAGSGAQSQKQIITVECVCGPVRKVVRVSSQCSLDVLQGAVSKAFSVPKNDFAMAFINNADRIPISSNEQMTLLGTHKQIQVLPL